MLRKGTAKKVTIFINEDTQHHFGSVCDSILTFLLRKGVSGATATRAMAGFGAHHVMHTLYDMVTDGVIEVHDTQVVKVASKDCPSPPKGPHAETVYRGILGYGAKGHAQGRAPTVLARPAGHDFSCGFGGEVGEGYRRN